MLADPDVAKFALGRVDAVGRALMRKRSSLGGLLRFL